MGQKSHLRNKDVTKLQKWKKNRPHREIKKTVKIPKRKENIPHLCRAKIKKGKKKERSYVTVTKWERRKNI